MPYFDGDKPPPPFGNRLLQQQTTTTATTTTKKRRRDVECDTAVSCGHVHASYRAGDGGIRYHQNGRHNNNGVLDNEIWDNGVWDGNNDRPSAPPPLDTTPRKSLAHPVLKRARLRDAAVSDEQQQQQQQQHNHHHHQQSQLSQENSQSAASHHNYYCPSLHLTTALPRPPAAPRSQTAPSRIQPYTTSISMPPAPAPAPAPTLVSSKLLAPCHICHRRPMRKSDLDSFAECEGCASRTCYVCVRECLGWEKEEEEEEETRGAGGMAGTTAAATTWTGPAAGTAFSSGRPERQQQVMTPPRSTTKGIMGSRPRHGLYPDGGSGGSDRKAFGSRWLADGHRVVVCSQCCVERGSDGDVACIGCLLKGREAV